MNLKSNKGKLPQQQARQEVSVSQHKQEFYQGPVPKPEDLQKYEQIQQGFANRLLTMAEKEQEERIKLNNKIIEENTKINILNDNSRKRGQLFAFLSIIAISFLCAYCVYNGSSIDARYIAIGTIVGVVGLFITGKFIDTSRSKLNQ